MIEEAKMRSQFPFPIVATLLLAIATIAFMSGASTARVFGTCHVNTCFAQKKLAALVARGTLIAAR